MLTFEKKIIPNKLHPYNQGILVADAGPQKGFLKALSSTGMDRVHATKIAKYAPRVLKSLPIQHTRGAKVVKTLKRIKKIGFIYEENSNNSCGNQWRLVLQNKFKLVKAYHQNALHWESLEKFKVFPNLTQVLLHGNPKRGKPSQNKTRSASFSWNVFRYVPGMVNLKALYLEVDSETPPDIMQRLNAMPRVYGKLQAFGINWTQKEDQENQVSFSSFIAKENIRKRLTHLSLENVAEENFVQTFELLSEYCQKLMFISIDFSQNNEKSQALPLRLLKDFHKLEIVQIFSRDIVSFLENFTLPLSTRDVSLNFDDKNWRDVYQKLPEKSKSEEVEEILRRLLSFGLLWKELKNLISLSVYARHFQSGLDSILCLLDYMSSNISSLRHFEFQLQESYALDFGEEYTREVALERIFSNPNFSKELRTVKIEFPWDFTLSFCPKIKTSFPKLTLLKLSESVLYETDTINYIFDAVQKRTSRDTVEILLDNFLVDANCTLVDLLEVLCHSPKNSKIELRIVIRSLDFHTFPGMFAALIERAERAPLIENVVLKVDIIGPFYVLGKQALSFLHKMFSSVSISEEYYIESVDGSEEEDDDEEGSEVDSEDDDFDNREESE